MKTPTLVISAVLVSLLAVSHSAAISEDNASSYSVVLDPIIKAILEKMRSKLANLKLEDINQEIKGPKLNATIIAKGISLQKADTFVINTLKSSLTPLKLNNLTLTWDDVLAGASYDVNAVVNIPEINTPARIFAKGDARITLKGLFVTLGANFELKGKVPQIKPKGIFGFDVSVKSAQVTLSSLMGSPEFGKAVGDFISRIIPDAVDSLKMPVFEGFHDTIVTILNQVIKKQVGSYMDDLPQLSSEELDSSEEFNFFADETSDF